MTFPTTRDALARTRSHSTSDLQQTNRVRVGTPGYADPSPFMQELKASHEDRLLRAADHPLTNALIDANRLLPRYLNPDHGFAASHGGLEFAAHASAPERTEDELRSDNRLSMSSPPPGVTHEDFQALAREMQNIRRAVAQQAPEGSNADYIPALVDVPRTGHLTLVFNESGAQISVGPSEPRTVQSAMKPIAAALALRSGAPRDSVACLPTASAFNAPSTVGNRDDAAAIAAANALKNHGQHEALAVLLESQGDPRPANRMNNNGAVTTSNEISSLVRLRGGATVDAGSIGSIYNLIQFIEKLAAGAGDSGPSTTSIDWGVDLSERVKSPGNYAYADQAVRRSQPGLDRAAHRARTEQAYNTYIDQCSLSMGAAKLALVFATLLNGGRNPRTGEQVVEPHEAEHAVLQMKACGLYEKTLAIAMAAGYFGKSGVSGMLVVQPLNGDPVTIGACDEPIDAAGNSAGGQKMIELLLQSEAYGHVIAKMQAHRKRTQAAQPAAVGD